MYLHLVIGGRRQRGIRDSVKGAAGGVVRGKNGAYLAEWLQRASDSPGVRVVQSYDTPVLTSFTFVSKGGAAAALMRNVTMRINERPCMGAGLGAQVCQTLRAAGLVPDRVAAEFFNVKWRTAQGPGDVKNAGRTVASLFD